MTNTFRTEIPIEKSISNLTLVYIITIQTHLQYNNMEDKDIYK